MSAGIDGRGENMSGGVDGRGEKMSGGVDGRGEKRKCPESDNGSNSHSPECLMLSEPARDPYSSDEGEKHRENRKLTKRTQLSSELSAELVQSLFYMDFEPLNEEISLEKASVKECLQHACRFASFETAKVTMKSSDQRVNDIYDNCLKSVPGISWIMANDQCDLHNLSADEYKQTVEFFLEHSKLKCLKKFSDQSIYGYARFMKSVFDLYEDLYININEDNKDMFNCQPQLQGNSQRHILINKQLEGSPQTKYSSEVLSQRQEADEARRKELLQNCFEGLALVLPCRNYRRDGQCRTKFPLVQNLDVEGHMEQAAGKNVRHIDICPDAVFVGHPSDPEFKNEEVWMLVVELNGYHSSLIKKESPQTMGPTKDIINIAKQQGQEHSGHTESAREIIAGKNQSTVKENVIFKYQNSEELKMKIKSSIPSKCYISDCLDKIAGQHVLHLFSMARQNLLKNERKNTVWINSSRKAKAVGLFIVNEFVFFSKLIVDEHTMWYLNSGCVFYHNLPNLIKEGKKRPKMSFRNFCFDLTIANHRKALILFLSYISVNNDQGD